MADEESQPAHAPIIGVGPRLKAAREAAGLSLGQMSAHTKIPERMLILIEAGNFAALPARTYATGFTRSYARALGLDEVEYVAAVRAELGLHEHSQARAVSDYEPGDPALVPSAKFAWLAAVAALVVVAAGLFLWRTYYAPAVTLPSLLPEQAATEAATTAPAMALPTVDPIATFVPTDAATEAATGAATLNPVANVPARRPMVHRQPAAPTGAVGHAPVPMGAVVPAPASTAQN